MKQRIENDAYYTRRRFDVDVLLGAIALEGATIIEPCAGGHDLARYLPGHVVTNDIIPGSDFRFDATDPASWRKFPAAQWVVSNPPFNQAHLIIPHAYEHATEGVAMLLRLSWLEPCENRAAWLEAHPLYSMHVLPRFSFDGSGQTDSVTCAWMIWRKGAGGAVYSHPMRDTRQRSLFGGQP